MKDDGKARDLRSGGSPTHDDANLRDTADQDATGQGSGLNDFTRTRLGLHLRNLYDQMAQQPVPDRFRDLIAQLEAGETRTQTPFSETHSNQESDPDR